MKSDLNSGKAASTFRSVSLVAHLSVYMRENAMNDGPLAFDFFPFLSLPQA